MRPANICIVLVEPQGDRNIGSVCRAMMNFGFGDLRLVKPRTDHLTDDARHMAVKAAKLLDNSRIFSDLAAALADCHLAMGTTRRFGKYRDDFFSPDTAGLHIASLSDDARTALVFGREDSGLSTEELALCQRFITIPTCETLPSMNLAQAVCLCLYEVFKALGDPTKKTPQRSSLATGHALEGMFRHMRRTLLNAGYLNRQNPDHIIRSYRRIFGRAGLDEREVSILQALWSRIDWLEKERQKVEQDK